MGLWFLHAANILYLVSYLSRDMLKLRIATCVGMACCMVYYVTYQPPLMGPFAWHIVFLLINCYQIYQLILERRETDLSPAMAKVAEVALEDMDREQLVTLLARDMASRHSGADLRNRSGRRKISKDEKILRQLVLDRLSRAELINLVTRRTWGQVKRRFKRKSRQRQLDLIRNPVAPDTPARQYGPFKKIATPTLDPPNVLASRSAQRQHEIEQRRKGLAQKKKEIRLANRNGKSTFGEPSLPKQRH